MQFDSFSAFINMGGYGFYVWLSFGISTALISVLIYSSITGHTKVIKNIAIRQQREDKLRKVRKERKNAQTNTQTNAPNEVSQ